MINYEKKKLLVTMKKQQYMQLEQLSKLTNLNVTTMIRLAIKFYLDSYMTKLSKSDYYDDIRTFDNIKKISKYEKSS